MKSFMDFRQKRIDEAEPESAQQQTAQPSPQAETSAQKIDNENPPDSGDPKTPRQALAEKIKPQADSAISVIEGINQAFQNSCAGLTKYDAMGSQIKNFEKQIRGACQQTMSIVEQEKFDWHNWDNCSPKSFKVITMYDDRDQDVVKLCAAIVVFYNSLLGKN